MADAAPQAACSIRASFSTILYCTSGGFPARYSPSKQVSPTRRHSWNTRSVPLRTINPGGDRRRSRRCQRAVNGRHPETRRGSGDSAPRLSAACGGSSRKSSWSVGTAHRPRHCQFAPETASTAFPPNRLPPAADEASSGEPAGFKDLKRMLFAHEKADALVYSKCLKYTKQGDGPGSLAGSFSEMDLRLGAPMPIWISKSFPKLVTQQDFSGVYR